MKNYKVVSKYGPGGRNCPCCGPAPGDRKKHDRTVKRRCKQIERKHIAKEIVADGCN